jgi:hypothetical protein
MANGLFDDVRKKFQAGTLLGGRGVLGDLVGLEARKAAQNKAIMQAGLGLLAQGPSRTPISFGQSMAGSLLGAQGAYDKALGGELNDLVTMKSLSAIKNPEYKTMNVEGVGDVLIDVNPQSSTFKQQISPTALLSGGSQTFDTSPPPIDPNLVPDLREAASGDVGGLLQTVVGGPLNFLGADTFAEEISSQSDVININSSIREAMVGVFGGKYTGAVKQAIEKVLPQVGDSNVKFREKATSLVKQLDRQIEAGTKKLQSTQSTKEKTKIADGVRALRESRNMYEAILKKEKETYGKKTEEVTERLEKSRGSNSFIPTPNVLETDLSSASDEELYEIMRPSNP